MTPIAVGVAAYLLPLTEWVEEWIKQFNFGGVIKWISAGMIAIAIVLCVHNRGAVMCDVPDMLADLKTANELLPNETVIRAKTGVCMANGAYAVTCFAYMVKNFACRMKPPPAHFYMTKPNKWGDNELPSSTKIYSGKTFDLYRL